MQKKKQPVEPEEKPLTKHPAALPVTDPEEPILPKHDLDELPTEDPFENPPPFEAPEPGEGP
jgi:hypothetical protein